MRDGALDRTRGVKVQSDESRPMGLRAVLLYLLNGSVHERRRAPEGICEESECV